MTLAKLHSGLSNLHKPRDKVGDVINCDLLSRTNSCVSFNFIPCVDLELQLEEDGYDRRYIIERQAEGLGSRVDN